MPAYGIEYRIYESEEQEINTDTFTLEEFGAHFRVRVTPGGLVCLEFAPITTDGQEPTDNDWGLADYIGDDAPLIRQINARCNTKFRLAETEMPAHP